MKLKPPLLSLILCSRNDQYMGNSRWRLETALDFAAERIRELGRSADVELLVADWGSALPLRDAVTLSSAAAEITSFLLVPPFLAQALQRDSPFPEVLALNAVARRARGIYIGRIDQDTLVGGRFLKAFFELCDGTRRLEPPLDSALLYANRRDIPYRFAVKCPAHCHVERLVRVFGWLLPIPRLANAPFWTYSVGIWLAHQRLWHESGGYDERLLYYNCMEVEMIDRLAQRYSIVNLGALVGCDFYHLEHVSPRHLGPRHQVKNATIDLTIKNRVLNPNGDGWGLANWSLELDPAARRDRVSEPRTPGRRSQSDSLDFALLLALTVWGIIADAVLVPLSRARRRWRNVLNRVRGSMQR